MKNCFWESAPHLLAVLGASHELKHFLNLLEGSDRDQRSELLLIVTTHGGVHREENGRGSKGSIELAASRIDDLRALVGGVFDELLQVTRPL